MKTSDHVVSGEELMAYVDGELAPSRMALVREHLSACEACRQLSADLQRVSRDMTRWQVDETPASLQAPAQAPGPGRLLPALLPHRMRRWQLAVGAVTLAPILWVISVVVPQPPDCSPPGCVSIPEAANAPAVGARVPQASVRGLGYVAAKPGESRHGAGGGIRGTVSGRVIAGADQEKENKSTANGPLIARTARLSVVAQDFDSVRPSVDRVLREVGGFIGQIDASGARGAQRSLSASLRVPATRLDAALASLKRIGKVTAESEGGDDVTEQVRDLDVRLANARATEKRLLDVLEHRTGKVADVLEAEREIARVRGEIEQMDAVRKSLDRRVTYATVSLTVEEERKAELDLGVLPPSARLRNALVDGVRAAVDSALGALLLILSAGPGLVLWGVVLGGPAWLVWRRRRSEV